MRHAAIKNLLVGTGLAAVLIITSCGSSSAPGSPPPNTAIRVNPAAATLYRGESQQFTALVSGQSNKSVTWSVPFGTIDSTGFYTAPLNGGGGDVLVTATSQAAPGQSGTATVTLPQVTFSIAPDAVSILPGASNKFNVTVDGLGNTQVGWTIQGAGGGTITNTGLYTAPSTQGVSYIVATSSVNANYLATATALVTATANPFSSTGDLQHGRVVHTATLLPNGKVLVAGGYVYRAYCLAGIDSAELYDPGSGSFASTGAMTAGRYAQTSTPLLNGDVLITGGFTYDAAACGDLDPSPAVTSAEVYDHTLGSFQPTGSMAEERGGHTATRLADGRVLITGGGKTDADWFPQPTGQASATAEIYDPATGIFNATGNMLAGRIGHTATLLTDGKVLISGGWTLSNATATAELYDPLTGVFTATGNMTSARAAHTATLLHDGRVLITGGTYDHTNAGSDTVEIYDPGTGLFTATASMTVARTLHTATLLPNNTVLVVGGGSKLAEIFDPATASFSLAGITESDRSGHTATLLQNGNVVVIGGGSFLTITPYTTAELFD